jgi:hypothetical protein
MNYQQALIEAISNKELVSNYDRLFKSSLGECIKSFGKGGINLQIDLATGRVKEEIARFDEFFYEYVWTRLPEDAFVKNPLNNLKLNHELLK